MNRIGNRSNLDLEELLKLKAFDVIAHARLWPQVRDRKSGQRVAEAVLGEMGSGRWCEEDFRICEPADATRLRRCGVGEMWLAP